MIWEKAASASTSLLAGTAAAGAGAAASVAHNPALYPIAGVDIPIFAVAVGTLTAALVRVISITSSPHRLWSYNAAVTALSMIGAAMFIVDHQTGPGNAFWVGAGFGAVGVGIVEVARSMFSSFVKGVGASQDQPPPKP